MSPRAPGAVTRWDADRIQDLVELCASALPDEQLLGEDLAECCFDDPPRADAGGKAGPSLTLGMDLDGRAVGALGLSIRHHADLTTAHVQVLAVEPEMRRRGIGRALLEAAEAEALKRGAKLLQFGAAAPWYLFTGVDSRWTEALCFCERTGFSIGGVELDLVCPTQPPGSPSESATELTPVRSAADAEELAAFAQRHYPHWGPELARGAEAGTAVLARRDGAVLGAAAHSVNRFGVIGPVAVAPAAHTAGIGTALMRALLQELAVAGATHAEIAWVSTVRFYALSCDARVLRASLQLSKWL